MGKLEEKTKAEKARTKTLDDNAVLGGDDILSGVDDLRAVPVNTHEWKPGSQCFVAELDAEERDELEQDWIDYREETAKDDSDNVGFRAFSVAYCLCDQNRIRLFEGREAAAANRIKRRNGKATSRLFNTISRINGLTPADVDELEKNSDATPPVNVDGSGE